MCGIAGAVGLVDEHVIAALDRVDRAQAHRGPDGNGSWRTPVDRAGPGVALAHRRLAILDLDDRAAQPMTDSATGNVIVFNGEIYNFAELRGELARGGRAFRTTSDTEVVLAAWSARGERALDRFAGMFAFALYEARTGDVVLARDRIGIKPLYFGLRGGTLWFASEVRALLASGRFERRIHRGAFESYVWHGFVCGDATIVSGIVSLPAGSYARVKASSPRVDPVVYWRIPRPEHKVRSLDALAAAVDTSTREHLVSDVPLAVFLSGGVDSSAVANAAARHHRGIATFHVGFEEAEFDESRHARAVADALGSEHHELRLSSRRFAADLTSALSSLDQPTFDAVNTWFVSRAVRDAGVVVALAGTGGDELFGGYATFRDLPRVRGVSRALSLVPRALLEGAARAAARARSPRTGGVPPQTRAGKLGDALATRGSLVDLYQTAYALFTRDFVDELLVDGERDTVAGLAPGSFAALARAIEGRSVLDAISTLEVSSFLTQRLLRDTDAASMDVSLEVRVPWLDHRVIEAAFALEDDVRFEALGSKKPLRDVGLGGLDPALFDRPKSGFVLPIERWCRAELASELDSVLFDARACRAVGLDADAVRRLWLDFQAGAPGLYWSRVWSLFVLMRWCDEHEVAA